MKPLCFTVMPYGRKRTGAEAGKGPAEVDFDALWSGVFSPMIEKLGYQPVRADQELGPLIIQDMLQRLAISDLVIADISIANANVYYEIGVRHAAKEKGCVMIAAQWAQPLFDLGQIRHLSYPDGDAATVCDALATSIGRMIEGRSPVYDAVPGYPQPQPERAQAFRDQMNDLADFQGKVAAARSLPAGPLQQKSIDRLRATYIAEGPLLPSVAVEILQLVRDTSGWQSTVAYIESLPAAIRELPIVQEQLALAKSKSGDHTEAIEGLLKLIAVSGETPERRGLLGGRYKKLYRETSDAKMLDEAIEQYGRGMILDLNEYYCSSNLTRLLRTRNRSGDHERARSAAAVTEAACARARQFPKGDRWLGQTLLGQAADAGDIETARRVLNEARNESVSWMFDSTDADVKMSISLIADEEVRAEFNTLLKSV
jgi:tetratricopeptide (TPR) repeat protein